MINEIKWPADFSIEAPDENAAKASTTAHVKCHAMPFAVGEPKASQQLDHSAPSTAFTAGSV